MNKSNFYWGALLFISVGVVFSLSSNDEVKLGNSYVYVPECRHITGDIDIPPVVDGYKFNKRYIVAKQTPGPFDNVIYDKMEYNYYLGRDTIYYWIIDKQTGDFWGPIDYNKYVSLLRHFNAPEDFLIFDSESSK